MCALEESASPLLCWQDKSLRLSRCSSNSSALANLVVYVVHLGSATGYGICAAFVSIDGPDGSVALQVCGPKLDREDSMQLYRLTRTSEPMSVAIRAWLLGREGRGRPLLSANMA